MSIGSPHGGGEEVGIPQPQIQEYKIIGETPEEIAANMADSFSHNMAIALDRIF